MARVFSPTTVLHRGVTAPSYGAGTNYPIYLPTIVTTGGLKQLDVMAALMGRVIAWEFVFSMSISGSWVLDVTDNVVLTMSGSASGTYDGDTFDYAASSPNAGYTNSEKHIAYGEQAVIAAMISAGGVLYGSWSGTITSDVAADEAVSGEFLVQFSSVSDYASYPIIVNSNALYAPFDGIASFVGTQDVGVTDVTDYVQAEWLTIQADAMTQPANGDWTIRTPDWRASGNSDIVLTTYDNQDAFAAAAT